MATSTFNGGFNWIVPDVGEVTLRCYGASGNDGSHSTDDENTSWSAEGESSNGANGGYAEGTLDVSPGDVLYIRFPSGGNGGSGGVGSAGASASANAGNGGDGAAVRHGSNDVSATVISAGGGGGGGAACGIHDDDASADLESTSGGAGGGNGEDGNSTSESGTATGGGANGVAGGDGQSSGVDAGGIGETEARGGGGGGGLNGGQGGRTYRARISYADFVAGHATGGGGGDGYVGGVSNSSMSTGTQTGSASVEIEYTPTPNAPTSSNAMANHQGPNIEVLWDIHDSITDGFYVYRSTTQGFTPGSGNRIATINNGSATSYTDSTVDRGVEYFYKVSAFESTSSNESDPSVETASTAGEVFKIDEGGTFTQYPIKYNDGGSWEFASELWVFSGDGGYSTSTYGSSGYGSSSTGGWEEQ